MDGLNHKVLAIAAGVACLAGVSSATPPPAADPRLSAPPTTPLYDWLSGAFPTLLIVAGGLIVIIVVSARRRAAQEAALPTLEERFRRLAEEREAERREGGAPSSPPLRLAQAEADAQEALDAVVRDTEELAERLAAAMDSRAARLEELIREADARLRRLDEARRQPALPGGTSTEGGGTRGQLASLDAQADPIQSQVFALADQGLTPVEIARRLGQPTGQVELMLALRNR